MDTAHWPQEIVVKPIEEIVTKPAAAAAAAAGGGGAGGGLESRKTRPQKEQVLNCPRCNSTNTKFCYYNNYSLTQPRYFCKTCRRYWTEGGSLRNIPVGGGSRKNKRSSSSHSSPSPSTSSSYNNNSSSKKLLTDSHHIQDHDHQNPNKMSMIQDQQGQDLNLAFPSTTSTTTTTHQAAGMIRSFSELMQLPNIINDNNSKNQISAMELLTGISSASRGLSSFPMQDPTNNMVFTSGFPTMNHQDFKPSLNFSLEGIENSATGSYGTSTLHGVQESSSNGIRSLFPFEDLKNVSLTTTTIAAEAAADHIDHNQQISREHGGDHSGYWTGMLGGGSW